MANIRHQTLMELPEIHEPIALDDVLMICHTDSQTGNAETRQISIEDLMVGMAKLQRELRLKNYKAK